MIISGSPYFWGMGNHVVFRCVSERKSIEHSRVGSCCHEVKHSHNIFSSSQRCVIIQDNFVPATCTKWKEEKQGDRKGAITHFWQKEQWKRGLGEQGRKQQTKLIASQTCWVCSKITMSHNWLRQSNAKLNGLVMSECQCDYPIWTWSKFRDLWSMGVRTVCVNMSHNPYSWWKRRVCRLYPHALRMRNEPQPSFNLSKRTSVTIPCAANKSGRASEAD